MNLVGPTLPPPQGTKTFRGYKNKVAMKVVDEFAYKLPKQMELSKRPKAEIQETLMKNCLLPAAGVLASVSAYLSLKPNNEPLLEGVPRNLNDMKARFNKYQPVSDNKELGQYLIPIKVKDAVYIDASVQEEGSKIYTKNGFGKYKFSGTVEPFKNCIEEVFYDKDGREIGTNTYDKNGKIMKVQREGAPGTNVVVNYINGNPDEYFVEYYFGDKMYRRIFNKDGTEINPLLLIMDKEPLPGDLISSHFDLTSASQKKRLAHAGFTDDVITDLQKEYCEMFNSNKGLKYVEDILRIVVGLEKRIQAGKVVDEKILNMAIDSYFNSLVHRDFRYQEIYRILSKYWTHKSEIDFMS